MSRFKSSVVIVLLFLFADSVLAAWTISSPAGGTNFTRLATIGGSGTGPANTGYTAQVQIGGVVENGASGTTDAYQNWQKDVPPPNQDPGWSCSDLLHRAYYQIASGGGTQARVEIAVTDSSCP